MSRSVLPVVLLLVCGSGVACKGDEQKGRGDPPQEDSEPRLPRKPLALRKTAEIPGDAAFHQLVDALAKYDRIESSHTGVAAAPSGVYAAFDALVKAATQKQILALLLHERPVVRGYLGGHVLRELRDDTPEVAPLFGDDTPLKILEGCSGGAQTVENILVDVLCDVMRGGGPQPAEPALALGVTLVRDRSLDSDLRGRVHGCVAARDGKRAAPIARALLQQRQLVTAALGAIAHAPSDEVATIAPFAKDPKPTVRQAAAQALGASSTAAALEHLVRMLEDPHREVQRAAAGGYTRHPMADPKRVATLLEEDATRQSVAWGIVKDPQAANLPAYEKFVDKHPKEARHSLLELARSKPSPPVTAFFRAQLAKHAAVKSRDASAFRALSVSYLGRAQDEASVPSIAASLEGYDVSEMSAASKALASIGGPRAIAALENALTSTSALVRVSAAESLQNLAAKSSAPKIEAAATTGQSQQDARLRSIAESLKTAE